MIRTARRLLVLTATTLGVVAATAGPAAAGMILTNHCEPSTLSTLPAGGRR